MTGAQKCSHVHGITWLLGIWCRGWIAMVLSAAWEYVRGVRSAIRGERRTCCCVVTGDVDGAGAVGVVLGVFWRLGCRRLLNMCCWRLGGRWRCNGCLAWTGGAGCYIVSCVPEMHAWHCVCDMRCGRIRGCCVGHRLTL